jgi:PrtD family type I secretion system ABC transporter
MSSRSRRLAPDAPPAVLRPVLAGGKRVLWLVAGLSFFLNLLVLVSPLYMLQVYDRVLSSGSVPTLIALTLIAAFAIGCMVLLDTYRQQIMARLASWGEQQATPPIMKAAVRATSRGQALGAQPLRDLGTIRGFVGGPSMLPFFDLPWMPVFTAVVWLMHPLLGTVTIISALVLLCLAVANEYMTRERSQAASRAAVAATADIEAGMRNADVLRGMGMLTRWQERNHDKADAIAGESLQLGDTSGWILGISRFIRYFVQVAVIGLGAWLVLKGEMTTGGMMAASLLFSRAVAPVERSIEMWKSWLAVRSAWARIKLLLAEHDVVQDKMLLPDPKGRLVVEGLTYYPPGSQTPTLRNVSFALEPGQAVCLVGPSGSGKTTLCRLLVGAIEASGGHVRLDGADLAQWDQDELGQHMGYLPQDVELFSGTIRENIARLREPDDDMVLEAAKLADVHNLVVHMPDGYGMEIGAGGARLSAGQRQRIGLARALYGTPKLVVLDEPNANLDSDGEMALIATLGTLRAAGVTVVMVTHRPSLMNYIDKMLVLREGQQAFFGNKDEIIHQLVRPPSKAGARVVEGASA